ncbi:leucine-rich repeat-containing protein 40-like [Centruroides vittatus]|uniref:leucine-rich repeat-containing protein 40-like n=1 Tax=Centruroides vittatus TaxID=120091 RepID=UPI0035103960
MSSIPRRKSFGRNRSKAENVSACFHPQSKEQTVHIQIIKQARKSGQLNLTNRGMIEVPDVVWNINTLTLEENKSLSLSMDETDGDRWWDQVDLTKLNLSSNSLISLSPDIKILTALKVLDLHDNQLVSLPDTLGDLIHLVKLNLSHNRLESLPYSVFELKELQFLSLQHNQLPELSDDISNLSLLEELDISYNKLKTIPPAIGFLSRVMVFNLSNNCLTSLPLEIGDMTAIRRLELTNNNLAVLPETIGNLLHLEQLYVQHNDLAYLPLFSNCNNLKELHVGHNKITEIPSDVLETLLNVRTLDLRSNKISKIPDEITWLQSLERFDLTNNNLSGLPYTLGILPHLKSLSIEGNSMRSIRRDIIQRGTVQLLKWLRSRIEDPRVLSAARNRHSSGEIDNGECDILQHCDKYTLKSSHSLIYSNKDMKLIPDDAIKLAAEAEVNVVDFSKNHLISIPDCFELLTEKLIELNLGFNKLTNLPAFLGSCPHLTYLDLRNNQVESLPEEFVSLEMLREINLSYNRFKEIPQVLFRLKKLEILFVSDNQIQKLDVNGLSQLPVLTVLDLRNNDISYVPPELGNLKQLRSLQLEGNSFRSPRTAILAKGTHSLLEYLRDRIPQ